METCTHVDQVRDVQPAPPTGCAECLKSGDTWVQLRMCMVCGHVGCCDSSKNKHATAHYHQTQHPVMRAYQAGKDWAWCYVDEDYLDPVPRAHAA
ncbi:MAG: UBP-type zinc finger domain-containing protein [Terriglobales bacterium]